ncbi:zf-HC2 domain-containing protein [uncultured Desulfobulbus sp.]|uniref:anti-sigma factor family protein n=1 Tax=uncultured Desulfobulbus sp. TaxID=239745 RepID=UPI0029C84692|nr:zf-HC2 domain-containing protein [uncultured Desulfobulbus sp.]
MKCERAKELLSDLYEGNIDYALTDTVRSHIDSCAACKHEYNRLKSMWAALNTMPDIDPPADFRHNVILKLAQAQNDKQNAKRSLYSLKWSDFVGQLRASRKVAAVCAGVILTALLVSVPKDTYRYAAGIFRPDFAPVTMPSRDTSVNDAAQTSVYDMSAIDKEKWMSRKLIRNAVWTSISGTQNGQNATLYKIELTKNNNALVNSSSIESIRVSVYIAPNNEYNIDTIKSDMPSWTGLITNDSSVTIPVIVDQSSDTVNLLITWTTNSNEYGQFVFLPSKNVTQSDLLNQGQLIETDNNLYAELRSIAKDFGLPVVVNSNLHVDITPSAAGAGTLNKELRNLLSPVSLDWLSADNVVYVDKEYTVNNE